jgi:polysaccharide biosynthesis/export protein
MASGRGGSVWFIVRAKMGDWVLIAHRRAWRPAALTLMVLAVAGCSFLPGGGPFQRDIRSGRPFDPNGLPYALVGISPEVLGVLSTHAPRLAGVFTDTRPPGGITFGVGDTVAVTIFESQAGGLYIPAEAGIRPGNFVELPNQLVDNAGNLTVPYAGPIVAAGRTPEQVQQEIIDKIKNRAIDPQAVVSLVTQQTSLISVLGDVNTPSRFPASHAGEHVLDAITRAGGPKGPGYDAWVMLDRNGRRAIAPFGALVYEPSNNIWVHPNDTIYLYQEPQTFIVVGATRAVPTGVPGTGQAQFDFGAWRVSLAEAIAKAGGLADERADPQSVFLYRGETREVAEQLGIDVSRFETPIIPVIYNLNLRDPSGFFLATKFQMRNKDVIYISNSPSTETTKFLVYLQAITGTINDPIFGTDALTSSLEHLRNAAVPVPAH